MEIVGCRGLENCCSFRGRSSVCRIGVAAAAAAVPVPVAAGVVPAVVRVVAGDKSIGPTKVSTVRRCIRRRVGCETDPS